MQLTPTAYPIHKTGLAHTRCRVPRQWLQLRDPNKKGRGEKSNAPRVSQENHLEKRAARHDAEWQKQPLRRGAGEWFASAVRQVLSRQNCGLANTTQTGAAPFSSPRPCECSLCVRCRRQVYRRWSLTMAQGTHTARTHHRSPALKLHKDGLRRQLRPELYYP